MVIDAIVIGGGIAGLSALHRLKNAGNNVVLLEKESACGGLVRSSISEGYLLETGPTAYLKGYKDTTAFVEELGMADQVRFNIPGADSRYVFRNGKIHSIPEGPISFLLTPLFPIKTKLRMLLEPFINRGKLEEETVYEFGKRRFGEDVSSIVMDAMVSGVCAGDFRKLDIFSLFPKIGMIEKKFKSFLFFLLLFKIKSRDKNKNNKTVTFRSFDQGMGQIASVAQKKYSDNIVCNADVTSIDVHNGVYCVIANGAEYHAKKLIVATPAYIAAKLLQDISPLLANSLVRIPYSSITTALVGFKKEQVIHPMKGFGFLVPRNQGKRILGGLFASSLFEQRAPEGHVSIKVYIGGTNDPDIQNISEEKLKEIILDELGMILGISGGPDFFHTRRINSAIPQYHLGHQKIKESVYEELNRIPGLFLAGNYLEGISVNEAIRSSVNCI